MHFFFAVDKIPKKPFFRPLAFQRWRSWGDYLRINVTLLARGRVGMLLAICDHVGAFGLVGMLAAIMCGLSTDICACFMLHANFTRTIARGKHNGTRPSDGERGGDRSVREQLVDALGERCALAIELDD